MNSLIDETAADGRRGAAARDSLAEHLPVAPGYMKLGLLAILLALVQFCWTGQAYAIPASTQFDLTGVLESATVDSQCSLSNGHCGGTLVVNGQEVIVPNETIVLFPASAMFWQEIFEYAPRPYTGLYSGMALMDTPQPLTSYEVHVVGNRVIANGKDRYIAALVDISQNAMNAGSGYVNYIDYGLGEIRVGGTIGDKNTGTRVRINDPSGRFGLNHSPDPRFGVDIDNPTVKSETGFPMCIPRATPAGATDSTSDAECPQTNRPQTGGVFDSVIRMQDPALIDSHAVPPILDPRKQAPLEVGDFISFSGTLVTDDENAPTVLPTPFSTANTYIAAYSITENTAIYTAPGTNPAYVSVDVALIGTGGLTVVGAGEAVVRTRFEGMSTDMSRVVHLYGVDFGQDGTVSNRDFGRILPDPGPPAGAVEGRWRFRPPCQPFGSTPTSKQCVMNASGTFLPPPREVRAVIEGAWVPGQNTAYAHGIVAGQYRNPTIEYIFPENVPGTPPPPNNFNTIQFLTCGGYSSAFSAIPARQLSPWADAGSAPATACPTSVAPIANAGPAQTVAPGSLVTLNAGASTGSPTLSFNWQQTAGPLVTLSGAGTAVATFTASNATQAAVTLSFQVTVSNGVGQSTATVNITVSPGVNVDTVAITSAEYRTSKQRLILTATSSVNSANVSMVLQPYACQTVSVLCPTGVFDPATLGSAFTNGGGGLYTLTLVGAPPPACNNPNGTYATPCTSAPLRAASSLGGVSPPRGLDRIRQ
jgi:hypothetical protein